MTKKTFLLIIPILLFSCKNDVEKITDPLTGTVLKQYDYYLDDNGQKVKDGTSSEWNSNGTIRLTENFKDGKREGESIFYESKDSIRVNRFKDDKLDGECILKNSKDVVLSVYNYSNGQKHGTMQYNTVSGEKHIVGEYKNDLQIGSWLYFDKNGKQVAKINFKDGVPTDVIGKWLIDEDPNAYFLFKDDGTYSLWEKYNKYALKPTETNGGQYSIGNGFIMEVILDMRKVAVNYDIEFFDGNKLILTYEDIRWVLTKVKN